VENDESGTPEETSAEPVGEGIPTEEASAEPDGHLSVEADPTPVEEAPAEVTAEAVPAEAPAAEEADLSIDEPAAEPDPVPSPAPRELQRTGLGDLTQKERIAAIESLGNQLGLTVQEIGICRGTVLGAQPCATCVSITEWIIKKAVGTGSCAAGEAALAGIFVLADIVFFEADEILIPLEVVVDAAWAVVCEKIGIEVLGQDAHKWAETWCKAAGLC